MAPNPQSNYPASRTFQPGENLFYRIEPEDSLVRVQVRSQPRDGSSWIHIRLEDSYQGTKTTYPSGTELIAERTNLYTQR